MNYLFASFIFLFGFISCGDNDTPDRLSLRCNGPEIEIVDQTDEPSSDNYTIVSYELNELCLDVTVSATGCSSEGWSARLITNGEVAESLPTQTSARLLFDDGVADDEFTCQALAERTFTFDLAPYLEGALPTRLELRGTESVIDIE